MVFIITIIIILLTTLSGFIIGKNKNKIQNKYKYKDINELVQANVFAKKYIRLCILFIIVVPIVLSVSSILIKYKFIENLILFFTIFFVVINVVIAFYYWSIEGITKSLIEQKEQDQYR